MQPRITLASLSSALTRTRERWGSAAEARVRVRLSVQGADAVELAEVEVRKDPHPGAAWEVLGYLDDIEGARRMVAAFQQEQEVAREAEGPTTRNDVRLLRERWKKDRGS